MVHEVLSHIRTVRILFLAVDLVVAAPSEGVGSLCDRLEQDKIW